MPTNDQISIIFEQIDINQEIVSPHNTFYKKKFKKSLHSSKTLPTFANVILKTIFLP